MDDRMLEKAVEDAQLIREVMDRSSDSPYLKYKVFIWWGSTFAFIGAVCNLLFLLWPGLSYILAQSPLLAIMPRFATGFSAFVIYYSFRRGMNDDGLDRQLMLLWLAVFSFSVVLPSAQIFYMWPLHASAVNMYMYLMPGIPLSWMALGMFCMYVFTRIKSFGWLSLISLLLYLACDCISGALGWSIAKVLIYSLVSPLTLMAAGIMIRMKFHRKSAIV